jgi:hypothetical protein
VAIEPCAPGGKCPSAMGKALQLDL